MPELPEVETTRRGLEPELVGRKFTHMVVRNPALRWRIARRTPQAVAGQRVLALRRRAKYLLIDCAQGHLILHLGMSGSLRILDEDVPAGKHDHVDLLLDSGKLLRFTDPRRFGSLHWSEAPPESHPLLTNLGVEPLSADFSTRWLYAATRGRRAAIKAFLMDARQIAGIGNIYANEALFRAQVNPRRAAGRLSLAATQRLVKAIKHVLRLALKLGGSSIRDFVGSNGVPGYFQLQYRVYDRAGKPCVGCGTPVRGLRLGQRSTFYCPSCQR